jgi:dissimilatory sulfite reductase related protein
MPALATVARTAEGFLERVEDWDRDLALALAAEAGLPTLTDRHWLVVDYMRNTFLAKGDAPTIRTLGKESGVNIKELYQLFPKGPAKLAAKIAGIPKPHGCI